MIFTASDAQIYGIEPGHNFAGALVAGLLKRCEGQPPETLARVTIYANTRRAVRMFREEFGRQGTLLLPRIRVLSDLAHEPLPGLVSGPTPSALQQTLHLVPAVVALLEADPDLAPRSSVFDLTESLLTLGREFEIEGLDLASLEALDPKEQDLQTHWQTSLAFLTLLRDVLKGDGTGPDARLKAATAMLAARWALDPPADPILVVGSTGSRGTTRAFMRAVLDLPQGGLVLPGYEFDLPQSTQAALLEDPDHPQHGFEVLGNALGFARSDVARWSDDPVVNGARNQLLSLALRPAPVTDEWLADGPKLKPQLGAASKELDLIEAKDERQEALAIALTLSKAHAEGQSAALITPNRTLARRVTADLKRWNITPDDSAGQPLHLTPPGIYLRLVVDLIGKPIHPAKLLEVLKHPLAGGPNRNWHQFMTRMIERRFFAGGPPVIDRAAVLAWWAGFDRKPEEDGGEAWIAWLVDTLDLCVDFMTGTLPEMTARHRAVAEAFAGGVEGAPDELWRQDAGEKAWALLEEIEEAGSTSHHPSSTDYRSILQGALSAEEIRVENYSDTKGIAIWGTLEARIQWADVIVLGGLNEGIWPRLPKPDPWLSRGMRAALDLPPAERQIGLSAHDFQQACAAPRVVLSRAQRSGGEPTVPSRWVTRLTSLLGGLDEVGKASLSEMRARGDAVLGIATVLEAPRESLAPASRPSPCPPVSARPKQLSVTQIETLIRDPYAVYARHVLNLRRLDPPGRMPDALERGNRLHEVLEDFWRLYLKERQSFSAQEFLQTAQRVFQRTVPWSVARQRWLARLERVAERFAQEEAARQAFAAPLVTEVKGSREIKGLVQPFKLTAIADRIDEMTDGRMAIYDYKAGGVATLKEINAFAKQLPLEACIAEAGGFKDIAPADVGRVALIGFTNDSKKKYSELVDDDIQTAKHWEQLTELIATYFNEDQGYTARLRPQQLTYKSDYDHLSRKGEWGDADLPVPEVVPETPTEAAS